MRVLKALVPMSEMLDFEPTLTSITGGRGSFIMEFSHYEEAPGNIQQKIIAEAVKERPGSSPRKRTDGARPPMVVVLKTALSLMTAAFGAYFLTDALRKRKTFCPKPWSAFGATGFRHELPGHAGDRKLRPADGRVQGFPSGR